MESTSWPPTYRCEPSQAGKLVGGHHESIAFVRDRVIKTPGKREHLETEVSFYETVRRSLSTNDSACSLSGIDEFLPVYFGRCNRETKLAEDVTRLGNFTCAQPPSTDSIELEDVTQNIPLNSICLIDVKLGTRTYEINVSTKPDERYRKKLQENFGVDWSDTELGAKAFGASAPSKKDYMEWRDLNTSSSSSGFRVTAGYITEKIASSSADLHTSNATRGHDPAEGHRFGQGPNTFKWRRQLESPELAAEKLISYFVGLASQSSSQSNQDSQNFQSPGVMIARRRARYFASRLETFASALEASNLLLAYDFVGSSVLLYYDNSKGTIDKEAEIQVGMKWIDFAHANRRSSEGEQSQGRVRDNDILKGVRNLACMMRRIANGLPSSDESNLIGYRSKWDKVYHSGKADDREWHSSWKSVAKFTMPYLNCISSSSAHVLDIGCGTSSFGFDLCQSYANFKRLSLLDASPVCVQMLKERYSGEMTSFKGFNSSIDVSCVVGDCRKLPYDDCSVHVLLDKGTLDALDNEADHLAMLRECRRVMMPEESLLLSISFGAAQRLRFFARELPRLGLKNDIFALPSVESDIATVYLNVVYISGSPMDDVEYAPDDRTKSLVSRALATSTKDSDPDSPFSAETTNELTEIFGNDSGSE